MHWHSSVSANCSTNLALTHKLPPNRRTASLFQSLPLYIQNLLSEVTIVHKDFVQLLVSLSNAYVASTRTSFPWGACAEPLLVHATWNVAFSRAERYYACNVCSTETCQDLSSRTRNHGQWQLLFHDHCLLTPAPKPFSPHYEHASNAAFAATSIIVGTGVHDQVQAHPRWGFGILQLTKLVRCLARGLKLATTSTIHRRETTHTRRLGVSNNDKLCVCTEW